MKSATQTFIEDAIAGGWKYRGRPNVSIEVLGGEKKTTLPPPYLSLPPRIIATFSDGYVMNVSVEVILLDPLAWQAVGKTRGWNFSSESPEMAWWKFSVFANHLFSGKTIEDALAKI